AGSLDHITISPTNPTITAGGSQVFTTEGFDSANNDLGSATGATTFSIVAVTGGGTPSCTTATCTASVAGTYTVTGTDGGKTASATLTVTSVPGAPTGVNAAAGDTKVTVSFTGPASNGGSAITTFTATCTSSDGGATGSNSAFSLTFDVTGLTNGKTYTCT